ncbi:uncharacterized protein AB675_3158 [Cyphellophora attinorum]|uniref:Protein SGT1 n=1 Tax=Cyphellophora attinorum TaxID=1664694 RepID=A0A0N1H802_9EURO|nr:uncharacterized protein AB675_3158 [Phialophora attinorum]KPI37904.1 hypothetical protein AB675_3158 [Phialophora attinorum]
MGEQKLEPEAQRAMGMWKAKVNQKLKNVSESERDSVTVEEFPSTTVPSEKASISLFKQQIKSDGTFDFEAGSSKTSTEVRQDDAPKTASTTSEAKTSPAPVSAGPIRQDWFQTTNTVTINLFAKGVDKQKVQSEINHDSVYISFPNPNDTSSEYTFSMDPSYGAIVTSSSKINVLKTKVEIVLQKAEPNQKWKALEGTEKPVINGQSSEASATTTQPFQPKDTPPAYPTSSRKGVKNWDKLAHEMSAKDRKEAKAAKKAQSQRDAKEGEVSDEEDDDAGGLSDPEGGDDVDDFFKKLYKSSDPDTQRAMTKSYLESGGTTLSTDWSDIGKRKVEPYKSDKD